MSNVRFLRGTQSKLNDLKSFVEGAFYLTSDTDRLYFAQSTDKLTYLNKYIQDIPSVNDLATIDFSKVNIGDFYYARKENILCTKANADDTQWTQINKYDSANDVSFIDEASFVPTVSDGNIVIDYTISQKKKDKDGSDVTANDSDIKDITGKFTITKDMVGQVQVSANVDVDVEVNQNVATVKTSGTGASTATDAGFKIGGSNGVKIVGSNEGITIEGQTYTLDSEENSSAITLKDKDGSGVGSVAIAAGASNESIVVNGEDLNKIVISHKDYDYNNAELADQDFVASSNPELTIISGLGLENGHITEVKTKTVKLTADQLSSVTLDNDGKMVLVVNKADGGEKYRITSSEKFGYTAGNGFVKVGSNLNDYYYTEAEIDEMFTSLNALTFKGGVSKVSGGNDLNLPINEVRIGDVYIVEEAGHYDGINASIGDLFIAYNADLVEDENGFIAIPSWTYVPSGNEFVYTYSLNALTFKGGVSKVLGGNDLNLPINEVRIGDVYIVKEAGHYNGINASIGDLFIAYNDDLVEDENGYIAIPSWTYVPSGNEFVYTYSLNVDSENNSIKLIDNAANSNEIILVDDDVIVATVDGNDGNKINFSHSKTNPGEVKDDNSQTLTAGNSFTAITEVNVNEYGHVIDRKQTTFTLPGENSLGVENNVIKLSNADGSGLGDVTIGKGNLITPVTEGRVIKINHDEISDNSPEKGAVNANLSDDKVVFTIVEDIERDASGHVTSIITKEVNLTTVNQFTQETTVEAPSENNEFKSTLTIESDVKDSAGSSILAEPHKIQIESKSLTMNMNNNVVEAEIVWGSF